MPKTKQKVWKHEGREDKFIERLISEGSFTKHTKPSSLKQKYSTIFDGFTDNVIRNHCNEMKRKNGLHCKILFIRRVTTEVSTLN